MSIKRQATTELNRDNWDQDDEPEEMGSFKTAPKEELEKRVIKTAKRRSLASGNEPKKSVFSGFGGFNKTQPSSFDFLANLTNGNKTSTPSDKSETSSSVGLLNSKPLATRTSSLFGVTATSTPTKPTFGLSQTTSLFGVVSTNTTTSSVFTVPKTSTLGVDSPFKIPASSSNNISTESTFKNINSNEITIPKMSSTIFGMTSENSNKTPSANANSTVFKIQQESGSIAQSNLSTIKSGVTENEKNEKSKCDNKKLPYYAKLKGLNESVSDWIKKHVDETPLCILTPIFKDYEKYLKEIQDEYHSDEKNDNKKKENESFTNTVSPESSLLPNTNSKPSIFGNSSSSSTATSTPGFSCGVFATTISTASTITSSPFSLASNTTTTTNGSTGFTFGNRKSQASGSNTQNLAEQQNDVNEEEDEPPKVEFTPVVEENSIYDKRCKIFAKKDGHFADKGVGTLYIKNIKETGKNQLLVRANTNLGTVLLNLILTSAIPTQRMGKNNVMLVCIPTPDSKPPPVPVLIRVKTSEEADELLETLNKYKT